MTNPRNTYDSEWLTVDQLSPRDFIANLEKGMNEHDEYLRTRGTHNPIATRWVAIGLLVFWAGVILTLRACA